MDGGELHRGEDSDDLLKEVEVLKAMAEPTRLNILKTLLRFGELSVTEICEAIDFDMSGISHHLSALKASRLVTVRREGKYLFYSVGNKERLARLLELLGEHVKGGGATTPASTATAPHHTHGHPQRPAYGAAGSSSPYSGTGWHTP